MKTSKIVSITPIPHNVDTYDIEVCTTDDNQRNFVANGIVVHNSNGIEPSFAHSYKRNLDTGGRTKKSVTMYSKELLEYRRLIDPDAGIFEGENLLPDYFVSAQDVLPKEHIDMQAAVQYYVDSSISKCVAHGTMILTNAGPIPVESIGYAGTKPGFRAVNDYVSSVMCGDGKWRKILRHYFDGNKSTKKVTFANGRVVEGSLTHKLKTTNGWKKLSELSVGEYVQCRLGGTRSSGKLELPIMSNIDVRNMSNDLATFLGMQLALGGIDHASSTMLFISDDLSVAEKYASLLSKLFNVHYSPVGTGPYYVEFVNSDIINFLVQLTYVSYPDCLSTITMFIRQGSTEELISFISGLSVGGSIINVVSNQKFLKLDFVDELIATQVLTVCVAAGFYVTKTRTSDAHSIALYGFKDCIQEHKNCVAKPITIVRIPEEYRSALSEYSTEVIASCVLDNLEVGYDKDVFYTKIVSIEDSVADLYDIEVEETHDYLIDGIVSHNTINVAPDTPYEELKDIYMYGYENNLKGCLWTESRSLFVDTPDGRMVRIGDVKEGDLIKTGHDLFDKVLTVYDNGVQEIIRYVTDSGRIIECTADHPFITIERDIRVEKPIRYILEANLPLLIIDNALSPTFEIIQYGTSLGPKNVMDIKIDNDDETYLLNGILVHNCTTFRMNPDVHQGILVTDEELKNTKYVFILNDGSKVTLSGSDDVEYDGETHNVANLYTALNTQSF